MFSVYNWASSSEPIWIVRRNLYKNFENTFWDEHHTTEYGGKLGYFRHKSKVFMSAELKKFGGIKITNDDRVWLFGLKPLKEEGTENVIGQAIAFEFFETYTSEFPERYYEVPIELSAIPEPHFTACGGSSTGDILDILYFLKENDKWIGHFRRYDLKTGEPVEILHKELDFGADYFDTFNMHMTTCYYDEKLKSIITEIIGMNRSYYNNSSKNERDKFGVIVSIDVSETLSIEKKLRIVSYIPYRNYYTGPSNYGNNPKNYKELYEYTSYNKPGFMTHSAIGHIHSGGCNETPYYNMFSDYDKHLCYCLYNHDNQNNFQPYPFPYAGPMLLAEIPIEEITKTDQDLLRVIIEFTVTQKVGGEPILEHQMISIGGDTEPVQEEEHP